MKRAREIQVGDRVFDRGISFNIKEILVDTHGHIHFKDMQDHIRGPYVPDEFIGVKRPGEKGDCKTRNVGHLCEQCYEPLQDNGLDVDWRISVGRTARLCSNCEEAEERHIPANHRGDDSDSIGSFPCDCRADCLDETHRRLDQKLGSVIDTMKSINSVFEIVLGKTGTEE